METVSQVYSKHIQFMEIAISVANMSKCKRAKVGCIIVDNNNRIISTGYNGTPKGTSNECECDNITHEYTLHAELNAIIYAKQNIAQNTIYVTMSPCIRCAAIIIQSGISTVYYKDLYSERGIQYLKNNNVTCIKLDM